MIKMILKKIIFSIFYFFFITILIANDYKDIIKETYSNRKLDTIEGLLKEDMDIDKLNANKLKSLGSVSVSA